MRSPLPLALLAAVSLLLPGCGGESPSPAPAPAAAPTREGLAAHFQQLVAAAKAQDADALKALVTALIPSRDELRSLLKPGPEADAWLAAYVGPVTETWKPGDAPKAGLANPVRTEIFVHQTTTEELAAYEKGSVAFAEFPGGMKDFARTLAAPGRTWWCVEAREPGKEHGTRYTAFAAAGGRFVLVVKPWRARPQPPPEHVSPAPQPAPQPAGDPPR